MTPTPKILTHSLQLVSTIANPATCCTHLAKCSYLFHVVGQFTSVSLGVGHSHRATKVKKTLLMAAAAAMTLAMTQDDKTKKEIVGLTPKQVEWFTPSYYQDGRQRAQLLGDSSHDGAWVDRVKIPSGGRVLAHTHSHDEVVTVIEGTWYLGEGERFDPAKLTGYPTGSFIVIPAGVPHFLAAKDGDVIVQLNGIGKFGAYYLEK